MKVFALLLALALLLVACAAPIMLDLPTTEEITTTYRYALGLPDLPTTTTQATTAATITEPIAEPTTEPTATTHALSIAPLVADEVASIVIGTPGRASLQRRYSSPENIARVVNYINSLEFTGVHGYTFNNTWDGGATLNIIIHMRDGSRRNFMYGNGFVLSARPDPFLYINPRQAYNLFQIIEENPRDN